MEPQDFKANLEERVVEVEQANKGLKRRVLILQDDWDRSVKSPKSHNIGMQERQVKEESVVTMFTLHLPIAVFSFSEQKLSSFALAKVRIILHYFHLCTHFFNKT